MFIPNGLVVSNIKKKIISRFCNERVFVVVVQYGYGILLEILNFFKYVNENNNSHGTSFSFI